MVIPNEKQYDYDQQSKLQCLSQEGSNIFLTHAVPIWGHTHDHVDSGMHKISEVIWIS